MTRLAFAASAVALLLAVGVSPAEDKLTGPAIIDVKLDAKDKLGVKPGEWAKPSKITSAEELEKLVEDKATREKIAKAVNLKTHDLLVFCWQGSGEDKIEYVVLESYPEQIPFTMKRGRTKDLRTHTELFAVRKNVRWSAK
jgi:hypothetical protein